ncbi:MAG TPA: ComEC/Rec2 family competence protein [Pirellulales bacterium]|jgi:competence protein ComEC|nr:ComEC/Rec2 family competence protein [Pirellulales bacterium]
MPYQPLVVVLAGVCAGIVADRQMNLPLAAWLIAGAVAWAAWLALRKFGRDTLAAVVLVGSLVAFGGAWHHAYWHLYPVNEIGRYARESPAPICIEAIAASGPRRVPPPPYDPLRPPEQDDVTRLPIRVATIRIDDRLEPASGNALLVVEGDLLGVHAGDRLRIFGRISAPSPAGNPGEQDFAELARGQRQIAVVRAGYPQCVSVVTPASGWSLDRAVEELRSRGDRLLWRNLSHERAGLAAAVLLGSRDELDPHRVEEFIETGTIHIVVVAGLHVGILAYLLFKSLRTGWMPRGWALLSVATVTGMYALVTDAEPPVVRATVLVWIVCGSMWLGRGGLGLNSLALAGLVVVALNPTDLFRPGTQLSFLAVAAIIAFERLWNRRPALDPLARLVAQTRPWPTRMLRMAGRELRSIALLGLTIWLAVLPLVMARFHLVTPAAILVNPLLIVPLTLAMASGFGVLLFGWLLTPLGALFGRFCDWNLHILEWSISSTASFRGSHFWVPGPQDWWLAVFYLGLAWIVFVPRRAPPPRWRWGLFAGWCGIGFGAAWLAAQRPMRLDCTFVSVGHGCGVVVELPDRKVIVSDAGRLGSPQVGAREISDCLWSRGLTHIDAIVISHNDTDHFNAVPELLRRFSVGAVYVSPVMFNRETAALTALKDAIAAAGVPLRETSIGDRFLIGDSATIRVLHPPPQGMGQTENADSILLAIEWSGRSILLTGDLASPGLEAVVAASTPPFDVAMVPHHGSATSNPAQFAGWCRAHWAVISGDLAHDSRIAVEAYQRSGAIVLNTATSGAVHVEIDSGGTIHVDRFRAGDRW